MRRLLVCAALATVAFSAAACGGSGDSGGASTASSRATSTSPAANAAAGADTPEGKALCNDAKRVLSADLAEAAKAYDDVLSHPAGSDEQLKALSQITTAAAKASGHMKEKAKSAPTPELKAAIEGVAAKIDKVVNNEDQPLPNEFWE
jgi:hypothetical protein